MSEADQSIPEGIYRQAWEGLKGHPLEVEAPQVTGVSQHRTLFDRVPELVSRGLLVTLLLVAVAQYFSLSLPLTVGFPNANLALAATLSGVLSAVILGFSIRAFRSILFPSVPSGQRLLLSFSLLLLLSFLTLIVQGTATWYWAFNLSGPQARIDKGLLLIEALSTGYWNSGRLLPLVLTVLVGCLGVQASWSYLARFAPWYQEEKFPLYARAVCGFLVFVSLSGFLLLPSYIRGLSPLTESQEQLVSRQFENLDEFRYHFSAAWGDNYQGALAEHVRTLAKSGFEGSDANKSALLLSEYDGKDSREALVLTLWIDQKLGFDHRRYAHDLDFEQQVVPKNLKLWNLLLQEGRPSLLWQMRNTGTLFALEHLLENPDTNKQTLLELREQLRTLNLSGSDLQDTMSTWFIGLADSPNNQVKVWGLLSTPEQELRRGILHRGIVELSSTINETDGTALGALERTKGDFSSLQTLKVDRKAFTIGMVPAFSADRIEILTQLPARLNLSRAAVEMRLFQLEQGRLPQNLEELKKTSSLDLESVSLKDGTLSIEVLDSQYSLKLPE